MSKTDTGGLWAYVIGEKVFPIPRKVSHDYSIALFPSQIKALEEYIQLSGKSGDEI